MEIIFGEKNFFDYNLKEDFSEFYHLEQWSNRIFSWISHTDVAL